VQVKAAGQNETNQKQEPYCCISPIDEQSYEMDDSISFASKVRQVKQPKIELTRLNTEMIQKYLPPDECQQNKVQLKLKGHKLFSSSDDSPNLPDQPKAQQQISDTSMESISPISQPTGNTVISRHSLTDINDGPKKNVTTQMQTSPHKTNATMLFVTPPKQQVQIVADSEYPAIKCQVRKRKADILRIEKTIEGDTESTNLKLFDSESSSSADEADPVKNNKGVFNPTKKVLIFPKALKLLKTYKNKKRCTQSTSEPPKNQIPCKLFKTQSNDVPSSSKDEPVGNEFDDHIAQEQEGAFIPEPDNNYSTKQNSSVKNNALSSEKICDKPRLLQPNNPITEHLDFEGPTLSQGHTKMLPTSQNFLSRETIVEQDMLCTSTRRNKYKIVYLGPTFIRQFHNATPGKSILIFAMHFNILYICKQNVISTRANIFSLS
jgi:hypothetical protein